MIIGLLRDGRIDCIFWGGGNRSVKTTRLLPRASFMFPPSGTFAEKLGSIKRLSSFATSGDTAPPPCSALSLTRPLPLLRSPGVFETLVAIHGNCLRIAATAICVAEIENSFRRLPRPLSLAGNLHGAWRWGGVWPLSARVAGHTHSKRCGAA